MTKNATAMLLSQTSSQDLGSANDLTTLVTALPNQGILYPQERRAIHFRFSPRYTKSNKGWKSSGQPPPRKDYTLFMHIETVGSVSDISDKSKGGTSNRGEVQLFCLFLGVFVCNITITVPSFFNFYIFFCGTQVHNYLLSLCPRDIFHNSNLIILFPKQLRNQIEFTLNS